MNETFGILIGPGSSPRCLETSNRSLRHVKKRPFPSQWISGCQLIVNMSMDYRWVCIDNPWMSIENAWIPTSHPWVSIHTSFINLREEVNSIVDPPMNNTPPIKGKGGILLTMLKHDVRVGLVRRRRTVTLSLGCRWVTAGTGLATGVGGRGQRRNTGTHCD